MRGIWYLYYSLVSWYKIKLKHRLGESIPRNRFLGSWNSWKYRLWLLDRYLKTMWTVFPPPRIFASCLPSSYHCHIGGWRGKGLKGWLIRHGIRTCHHLYIILLSAPPPSPKPFPPKQIYYSQQQNTGHTWGYSVTLYRTDFVQHIQRNPTLSKLKTPQEHWTTLDDFRLLSASLT